MRSELRNVKVISFQFIHPYVTQRQTRSRTQLYNTRACAVKLMQDFWFQDLCLLDEFSIKESLFYFGRLGGMTDAEINVQCDYLVKLLELPSSSRVVGTLR